MEIKPTKVEEFHRNYFAGPPMTGQYKLTFTGEGKLNRPDLKIDTKDVTLFLKAELGVASELGGWSGPLELKKYIGKKPITVQLSIRNGSVEVYPYGGGTGPVQFTRIGARLLAATAKSIHIALGGDGKVKHNQIKQFTPHKNESVNEADKATLDTVSRRMFGKSYSRLTMDQAARVKASLREAMVSPKSGHNYYQLTKDVPVRYVAYQTNPTGATGVMLHNTPGHLKGKKGAYIIDYYGGHYYVDMKAKFATAIYDLDQQSFYRKPVYKEVDSAPDFASWKSYKKEIPFKRESVNETLIKEAKVRLGKDSVNFKVMGDNKGLTLIAASGNDLDGLQDAIANDVDVKDELRKTLEKQLKVPVDIDHDYSGAGFRFNIDFYSLAKKVK